MNDHKDLKQLSKMLVGDSCVATHEHGDRTIVIGKKYRVCYRRERNGIVKSISFGPR